MKALFYLKMNGKLKKVREEEMPADFPKDAKFVMGVIAISFDLDSNLRPKCVKFLRVATPLDDEAMFMYDVDAPPKFDTLYPTII